MKVYTVELKNQPGELAHVCEVLGRAEVNIELAGATSGDHGTVYFTASDESGVAAALEGAGIEFSTYPALRVTCADQPGEAAKFARKLANANINAEWLLPVSICQGEVAFALCVDKFDEARTMLGDQASG
ncbi:hypothetical protein ACFLIM_45890 [Nonomuraea sp. M3C6]|uniref:ACT domain-containing protein n=1 Tax=Nonomuraea marmarensis TaxID=3351344 RepID=A0ABW7ASW6_9ACTN